MPTRNTKMLIQIIEALGHRIEFPTEALARLEEEFEPSLIIVAGDLSKVAQFAEQLRLAITTAECGLVLDHIGSQSLITIDQVEEGINALFPGRFIEP